MKLLLIDGANFLHRARAGFEGGEHALMFNFFRNLRALIGQHNPDKVIYVLEGRPKARYDESPDYKANRVIDTSTEAGEKKHAEMSKLFAGYDDILKLMREFFPITIARHPDHECDDVIHNLAVNHFNQPNSPWKMSEALKDLLIETGSSDHVKEFGECVGHIEGYVDYNDVPKDDPGWDPTKIGPEVDVRWQPSNLRYAYARSDLVPADEVIIASSDSDFTQSLTTEGVKLWNMRTKSWIERTPYDYVTWKALKGDPTDNIKGIPGIGQKRATALALDPSKLGAFLYDSKNSEIYERNVRLIRFHDFKENDWKELVMTNAQSNWEGVRQAFDDYGFKSITNDKSWKKFVQTFENANKVV